VISGFQASNIGQYGIADFSFATVPRPFASGWDSDPFGYFYDVGVGTESPFFDNPILDALGQFVSAYIDPSPFLERAGVPGVRDRDQSDESPQFVVEDPRPEAVLPETAYLPGTLVIDPEYAPEETVFEEAVFEPGNEWLENTPDTDWGRVYDAYVILNNPPEEEVPVFDWLQSATTLGQLGSAVGWWGDQPAPAIQGLAPPMAAASGAPPAKVTLDTRTGKITKCKRRRRRKLLTESDFNVLLRVATLPNKENVRIVLGKAIGRS